MKENIKFLHEINPLINGKWITEKIDIEMPILYLAKSLSAYSYAYNCDLIGDKDIEFEFKINNKGDWFFENLSKQYEGKSNDDYFYIYKLIPELGVNTIVKYDFTVRFFCYKYSTIYVCKTKIIRI